MKMKDPEYVNFSADISIIDRWKDCEGIKHVRLNNGLVGEQAEDGTVTARIKLLETSTCFFSGCKKTVNKRGKFCEKHDKKEREAGKAMAEIFNSA